jgi:undecaprenyl-diphosphatase
MGIIQGLTEFLPVSSSAHLTFAEHLFGIPASWRLTYDVLLHLGTTFALLVYFAPKLRQVIVALFSPNQHKRRENWTLVLAIAVGTIPAALAGVLLRDRLEALFARPVYSAFALLVTGVVLFCTRKKTGDERRSINWRAGLVVGMAQAFALLPGISRSGVTISAALFLGLARSEAFEFSFLLSIPAVLGAAALKLKGSALFQPGTIPPVTALLGLTASVLFGLLALVIVRKLLLQRRFHWFAFYCWGVGLLVLLLSLR